MNLELKISTFINKAQTKSRSLSKYLISNFDPQGYQSPYSREALTKIYETKQFIRVLSSEDRGEMSDKQINNLIDFFNKWLELNKTNVVTYTNYSMPIQGETVNVPSNLYALKSELVAEQNARSAADAALNQRIDDLIIPDPGDFFPDGFADNYNTTYTVVFDDDIRLHTHSNKATLDAIDGDLLSALQALPAHYLSINAADSQHVTTLERAAWNAKISSSQLTTILAGYSQTNHTHLISQITGLEDVLNAMNDDISNMAGSDGREVELQLVSGETLQWRYTGDVSWTTLGNIKGDQGEPGTPFHIDVRGLSNNRYNSLYNGEDANFTYLETDTGYLYWRYPSGGLATVPEGWSTGIKFVGDDGWSPILGLVNISADRAVYELIDWAGGNGSKPVLDAGSNPPTPIRWYLGAGGFTLTQELAINVRGPKGQGYGPIIGDVGNLAGRDAYDNAAVGFIYMRNDVSPQTIFIKNSDSSADWSQELPWQGPPGAPGSEYGAGVIVDCGGYDASSNVFPTTGGTGASGAIKKGNQFDITVSGILGGVEVSSGSTIRAKIDTPGNTLANWRIYY